MLYRKSTNRGLLELHPLLPFNNEFKQKRVWVSLDGDFWFGGGAAFRGDCRNAAVVCRTPG